MSLDSALGRQVEAGLSEVTAGTPCPMHRAEGLGEPRPGDCSSVWPRPAHARSSLAAPCTLTAGFSSFSPKT